MVQDIIVYIIIAAALVGLGRFTYRKLDALRKKRGCTDCTACSRNHKGGGCCCH